MLIALTRILLLCAVFLSSQALAGDSYVLQQEFFEDKTNSLSFAQVKNEKFTPYEGWLAKGYSPSTYWFTLTVNASNKELVARIRPAYAESIQVFDAVSPTPKKVVGARYAWRDSDIPAYSHNFTLAAASQERQIFLKIKYARTYLLSVDVMTLTEYLSVDHVDSLLYMGYIVFTFALALGLFGAWLISREKVLGVFTIQQFVAFLHTFFVVGYARIFFDKYIDVSTLNYASYVLVVVYPLVGLLANKLLLEEYGLKRLYRYSFNCLICGSSLVIVLLMLGYIGEALKLNAQIVMLAIAIFCLTAWFGIVGSDKHQNINLPINVLRVYYAFNLVMWLTSLLPLLGAVQAKDFAVHSYLLYNVFSGLFFFLLLQYRSRLILKNELMKAAALKKEADDERFLREEQGKLMAMLTHEIRTPLSVLKLVIDRKVAGSELEDFANRAVSNIDSIIDKCIQLDQLDLKALKINKAPFNLSDLIVTVVTDSGGVERVHIEAESRIEINSDINIVRVIISNLAGNAVRYSIPNSDIQLSVALESSGTGNSRVRIIVQNDVSSIDIPDASQVFDKYYRGPSSTRISGSGLGLFIVRDLVHALGGEVRCSIHNNSIAFTVWIPI